MFLDCPGAIDRLAEADRGDDLLDGIAQAIAAGRQGVGQVTLTDVEQEELSTGAVRTALAAGQVPTGKGNNFGLGLLFCMQVGAIEIFLQIRIGIEVDGCQVEDQLAVGFISWFAVGTGGGG